jgi:hypothetical protein
MRRVFLRNQTAGKITNPMTEIISMAGGASRHHLEDVFCLGPHMLYRD